MSARSPFEKIRLHFVSSFKFADRVLERGEKIELLVDKTDRLNQQAIKFERSVSNFTFPVCYKSILKSLFQFQSRSLKREMYCRKIKMYALAFVIVAVSPSLRFFLLLA